VIKLLPYQQEYMEHTTRNFVYDMDTGTGKTYMGLYHWRHYYPESPLLIVAPASKINEQGWNRTIDELLDDVEFEAISYNKLAKDWQKYRGYFVIFDECHRLKNSTGKWGKAGFNLTRIADGFILLSATPTPNNWEDMINYFKMFKLTPNKTQFLKKHAVTINRFGYNEIVDWNQTDVIEAQWKSISRRLNKSEALELPPLVFQDVLFKASPVYKRIQKTRMLDDDTPLDNMMSLRHGLRVNTNMKDKSDYLKEFLDGTKENVLVFYNYDLELEQIKKSIPKGKNVFVCNGHEKHYPKKNEWGDVENSVTIANYKSGSEAVEFTYTTVIVYFSPTESYTEFYQSYGRTHRMGQTDHVTAYKFITQATIERDIYRALDNKQDFNIKLWEQEV